VRCVILESCMEFAIPKSLMEGFVALTVSRLVEHFHKDDQVNNRLVFQNRRMYAKCRRLGYFVPECEELYKRLIFDQLNSYDGMYDFESFQVENPIIEEVEVPVVETTEDISEPKIETVEPKIEEVKEPTEDEKVLNEIFD
jgi:hypothetical protein